MRLVITGATGFIGTALCDKLLEQGHALILFTRGSPRDAKTGTKRWLYCTPGALREWDVALDGADGVINLEVAPEVSSIDPSASVVINNLRVPGLQTRR